MPSFPTQKWEDFLWLGGTCGTLQPWLRWLQASSVPCGRSVDPCGAGQGAAGWRRDDADFGGRTLISGLSGTEWNYMELLNLPSGYD